MKEKNQNRSGAQAIAVILVLLITLMAAGCGSNVAPTEVPPATDTPAANTPTVAPTTAPTVAATPTADAAPAESTPVAAEETVDPSYPAPADAGATAEPQAEPADYPAPVESFAASDSYPAPVTPTPETSRIPIVPFVLERPLETGATVVRGTGPANAPIVIADIFLMGEILGEGVIDAEGRFEVTVTPLEQGHWVGIALADLRDTDFLPEDFYAQGFRGEGAEQVPQVGFIFDSDLVR